MLPIRKAVMRSRCFVTEPCVKSFTIAAPKTRYTIHGHDTLARPGHGQPGASRGRSLRHQLHRHLLSPESSPALRTDVWRANAFDPGADSSAQTLGRLGDLRRPRRPSAGLRSLAIPGRFVCAPGVAGAARRDSPVEHSQRAKTFQRIAG